MLKRIDILNLPITNINYAAKKATKERWDSVAKPLDGMGDFEELFAQIGGIRGTADFTFEKRAVIVMCGQRHRGRTRKPDGAGGHCHRRRKYGKGHYLCVQDGGGCRTDVPDEGDSG